MFIKKLIKGVVVKQGIKELSSYKANKWTKRLFLIFVLGALFGVALIVISALAYAKVINENVGYSMIIGAPLLVGCSLFAWLTYLVMILDKPYSKKKEDRAFAKLRKYEYKQMKKVEKAYNNKCNRELRKQLTQEYKANKK